MAKVFYPQLCGKQATFFFQLCHSSHEFVSSPPYHAAIESLMKKNQQRDCLEFISSPEYQAPFSFHYLLFSFSSPPPAPPAPPAPAPAPAPAPPSSHFISSPTTLSPFPLHSSFHFFFLLPSFLFLPSSNAALQTRSVSASSLFFSSSPSSNPPW